MKKLIAGSVLASMLVAPAMAQDVSVYLNNERMVFDQNPIIENGRTLVPLRSIFEGLGAEVKWNPELQEIRGITKDKEVVLRVGETSATVNGQTVTLDVAAKIENGRTLVPLRFISESLEAEVKWNAEEYRIDIESREYNYDTLLEESEGLSIAMNDGKYGFADSEGKIVIPCIYDEAEPFSEGLAAVFLDWNWSFIDTKGNVVITDLGMDVPGSFYNGLACIQKDEKYGYINKSGEVVIPFIYDSAMDFNNHGLAGVCKDKWGYINTKGEEVIPFIYEIVDQTKIKAEELLFAKKDGKYGFIDTKGNTVIPFVYDQAMGFGWYSKGQAWVMKDGKSFYIDKSGNVVE